MKILMKLSHDELFNKFKEINSDVNVLNWQPLLLDECRAYADTKQPIIRVELADGNWLRVYVSEEFDEINWY